MIGGSNLPPRKRWRGNLRPAPEFLSVETIANVVALAFPPAPAPENREITRFDTTVKPSSNDNNQLVPPSVVRIRSGKDGPRGDVSRYLPVSVAAAREETSPHPIPESTTAHPFTSGGAPGSNQGPAAAVTSGGAAGGCGLIPANAGQAQAGAGLGPHRPSTQASRVRVQLHRGETPPACVIRAAAKALGVAIRPARAIAISEGQRFLKAYEAKARRQAQGEREQVAAPEIKRAPSREECPRCGIPGFKGCAHFRPCEVLPPFPPQAEESDRRKLRFTGKRRGIGAMPI